MVQGEESEVDGIGYDEAGKTWKRLQTLCLVSPTVSFGEYSRADAQVMTRERSQKQAFWKKSEKT